MFESNEFDEDDWFKGHSHEVVTSPAPMGLVLWLCVAVVAAVLLAIVCRCCCQSKSRGRVIAPPPLNESGAAPYPQQQYTNAMYPAQTVTAYPVVREAYPTAAPYPTGAAYPGAAPHPAAGPYPATGPYPAACPYPAVSPYPAAAPYPPAAAPSAPDVNACPPSYEQVMGGEHAHKQPPFNPNAPH